MLPGPTLLARLCSTSTIGCIVILCVNAAWIQLAGGEDWPQFRGPNRNGRSEETGILGRWSSASQPKLVTTLTGAGRGYGSLCVVDSIVYVVGNSEFNQFVAAIDLKKGTTLWKSELVPVVPNHFYLGSRSTPTWYQNKLYVVGSDGRIACFDAKTGKQKWQKVFSNEWQGRLMSQWGYSESSLVVNDRVIVTPGGKEALMVALDPDDGSEQWRLDDSGLESAKNNSGTELNPGAAYSSAIAANIGGESQILQVVGQGLIGVRVDDGKLLWSDSAAANTHGIVNSPVEAGGTVVYSSARGGGIATVEITESADKVQAKRLRFKSARQIQLEQGGMILDQRHIFAGHGENRGFPICVDMDALKVKWGGRFRGPGSGSASVVYCDKKLIFRYQNGVVALIAADPSRYRLLGSFTQAVKSQNRSWAHPAIADGMLLLREHDSIMVYDLKNAD